MTSLDIDCPAEPGAAARPKKALPVPTERLKPRSAPERKQLTTDLLAAIAAHIEKFGRTEWDRVRECPQFAAMVGKQAGEAGRRKFWRYVQAVSQPTPPDRTRPHEAREAATAAFGAAVVIAREAEKHLPCAPPPSYLMRAGAQGRKNIDFLADIEVIREDVECLRSLAFEPDEASPGGWRIKDPKLLNLSISRRLDVMETGLRLMQEIWDLEHQRRFYEAVSDILISELAAFPEIQTRVIARLADINATLGMTPHAEVR